MVFSISRLNTTKGLNYDYNGAHSNTDKFEQKYLNNYIIKLGMKNTRVFVEMHNIC